MSKFAEMVDAMYEDWKHINNPADVVTQIEECLAVYLNTGPDGEQAEQACVKIAALARVLWEGDF